MPKELVDAALYERMTSCGEGHVRKPAVRVRALAPDQARTFGAGQSLRDGAGTDQGEVGYLAGGKPVGIACAAQRGQQVEGSRVNTEAGQRAAPLVGEQLADPPDARDDADRARWGAGSLAFPCLLDLVYPILLDLVYPIRGRGLVGWVLADRVLADRGLRNRGLRNRGVRNYGLRNRGLRNRGLRNYGLTGCGLGSCRLGPGRHMVVHINTLDLKELS